MDLDLNGKHVVVTGGGSNIGRAIVLAYAKEGCSVTIADLDEEQSRKVVAEAVAAGAKDARAIATDVTQPDSIAAMVRQCEADAGGIDVLVNNVGWTVDRLFLEKPREEWQREVDLNLWSVINCIHAVLPGMVERGHGAIVSVGSDAGRIGEYREAVYGACKAGVIALSKSLSREYGKHGVRFNVVCPGTTMPESDDEISALSMWRGGHTKEWNTPEMRARIAKAYPLRRVGTPQDVAPAVVFLSSQSASFITGQTLSASGGYSMV